MFKFVVPVILIAISIFGFLVFAKPLYNDISVLREQATSYNEALSNSKALENERDKLTKKYNTISSENLEKIKKLLPENVDNIRLILEIEKIALPYGMVLRDVRYDTFRKTTETEGGGAVIGGDETDQLSRKNYGTWSLEFSTQGTYDKFISFIKDLEKNLRIVDISSITFSSNLTPGLNPSLRESYQYSFKINTYWLKN